MQIRTRSPGVGISGDVEWQRTVGHLITTPGTGPAFRRARLRPEGAVGRPDPARGLALHTVLRAGPPRPPGGSAAPAERSGQKPAAGRAPGGHGRLVSRPLIHARLAFLLFGEHVPRVGRRFLGYHCLVRLTV